MTKATERVPHRAMLRFSVLPLTVVAALTPPEYEVRIVDENVEALDFSAPCDLVGISFMTALAPRAYEIAEEYRRRGKKVVGGGYHPTLCPRDAAPHFDALVLGDAEPVWQTVLDDFARGTLRQFYGAVSGVPESTPCAALESPTPRRDLLTRHQRHYATLNAVQAGRGCRHQCRYCSVTQFHGHRYRHRSVADVIAEIRAVEGDFIFVDDNIIADRQFCVELFQALVPLRKRWVSQCSLLIADDAELLRLAHAAGCRGLFIGIETASASNLATMKKDFNDSASYRERIAKIRTAGIGVIAGFIVGMDGDTKNVFEDALRFLDETRVDALQLNILTPLPGTPLFADHESAGRISDRDWSHYDYRRVVFEPARMSAAELQAGADWLYARFYRLDRVLWRFARSVFTLGWMPALLSLKLNLTYRYDNKRDGIVGWNPSARAETPQATARGLRARTECS